ncbi:MAG: hypothetical protein Q9202_005680 [Teloschistes flavicans]
MALIHGAHGQIPPPTPSVGLFDLPLEIRHEIYSYLFLDGIAQHPWATHNIKNLTHRSVPAPLSIVSQQFRAELLQLYFERTYAHVCIDGRVATSAEPSPYLDHFGNGVAVLRPPATSIRHWCVHLAGIRSLEYDPDLQRCRYLVLPIHLRKIIGLLHKNRDTIKSIIIKIPCLCCDWGPRSGANYKTPEKWSSIVLPQLQPLSQLRIPKAELTFAPIRMETFHPCILPRCKALLNHLEELARKMQGKANMDLMKKTLKKKKIGAVVAKDCL